MEWISVKDRPLLKPIGVGKWEITEEGGQTFIAHMRIINNGNPEDWVGWVYIPEDTIDLVYVGSDENVGWDATDVENYILLGIPEPPVAHIDSDKQ